MDDFLLRREHIEFAKRMEEEHTRMGHRLEMLEENYKQLNELTTSVKLQTMTLDNISKKVDKQGEQIDKIVNAPAEKWNTASKTVLTTAVSKVVDYLVFGAIVLIALKLL